MVGVVNAWGSTIDWGFQINCEFWIIDARRMIVMIIEDFSLNREQLRIGG